MGSVRRRLEAWKNSLLPLLKRIIAKKKWILQLVVIGFLFLVSLFIYIKISTKGRYQSISSYKSKILNNAINQYRLENFLRAEMIFNSIIEKERNKNEVSIAFLYLGNIMLKKDQYNKALAYYREIYNNRNFGKYAYYNSAIVELKRGEIDQAVSYAKRALHYDKLFMEADLLLGNLYYLNGDYKKALKIYDRYQYNPVFLYNKAITILALGDRKAANNILSLLITRKDVEKVIKGLSYFELGNIYEKISLEKASFYYLHAYKIFNQNNDLLYNASVLIAKSGDYNRAGEFILGTNIGNFSDKEKIACGYILYNAGNYEKAKDILSSINGKNSEADIILGEISLKNGDIKRSEKYYENALKVATSNNERIAVYNYLISLYQKAGMLNKAVKACKSIDEKDKNFSILISCAKTFFERNENEKALILISKALEKSNNDKTKLFQLASIYFEYGYSNNALKVLYRVRDLYPEDYRSLLGIAKIFLEKGQKDRALRGLNLIIERCRDINIYYDALILKAENIGNENAENVYRRLIKDFPYRYEAYYNLARLYLLKKRYEESIELINRMFTGKVKIPEDKKLYGYILKGIALFKIGKNDEAYRAFKNAVSIDKDNEIARVNLDTLKSISK